MDQIMELGRMLFIGAGLGILIGILMKWNQYKDNKMKENLYNTNTYKDEDIKIKETEEKIIDESDDYLSEWEKSKKR